MTDHVQRVRPGAAGNEARVVRSLVYAPAHDRDAIRKLASYGPDAVCMDMEDLTPPDGKVDALKVVPAMAAELAAMGIVVMARTNGLADGQAAMDLDAIVSRHMHAVCIPKAAHAHEITAFEALVEAAERRNGVPIGWTWVRPVVETAMGIRNAFEIAMASDRIGYMGGVSGSAWGDLGASLGFTSMTDNRETFYLRTKVLVDVRSAGAPFPISGGHTAASGLDGYRAFTIENRNLGYNGVHCTAKADVIAMVNEVFTPSQQQLDEWLPLMPALEEAERDGKRVAFVNGRQYDLSALVRVREQIDLAKRLGLVS